jgi:hypothetical protein
VSFHGLVLTFSGSPSYLRTVSNGVRAQPDINAKVIECGPKIFQAIPSRLE